MLNEEVSYKTSFITITCFNSVSLHMIITAVFVETLNRKKCNEHFILKKIDFFFDAITFGVLVSVF